MSEDGGIIGFIPTGTTNTIKEKVPLIMIASLTLIATLAWNEAFKSLIDQYIPEEYKNTSNAWFKVLYAFVLTLVIVIVMSFILHFSNGVSTLNHN